MITDRQTLNEVDERIEGLLAERIGRAAAAGPA
jgi:chorismate mutase